MWDFTEAVTGDQLDEADATNKDDTATNMTPTGLFDRLWQEIWGSSKELKSDPTTAGDKKEAIEEATDEKKKSDKSEARARDLVFHFSLRRYNPGHASSPESEKASDEGGDASVSASATSNDIDAASHANDSVTNRRQTRSTRSTAS